MPGQNGADKADALRELEVRRLDTALRVTVEALHSVNYVTSHGVVVQLDGQPLRNYGPNLQAAATLVRLSARRSRLLGLDAPTQPHMLVTLEAIDREIRRLEAEVGQQIGRPDNADVEVRGIFDEIESGGDGEG